MPNIYTENSEKWRAISHIDYLTQFVKAWIPFNAWYKNYYPDLKTDKDAIDAIKTVSNRFKDKLENLLNGTDNDSAIMKNAISNLHYQLERHTIKNNDVKISFKNIVIGENPKRYQELTKYTWKYEVTRDSANSKLITSKITDRNGSNKLLRNQNNGFNIDELKSDNQYQSINRKQRKYLEYCYNEINPKKPITLISNAEEFINISPYKFINNADTICKGVISILYLLRNSLFHGQIIPDKETNKVYEQAYNILHRLVEEL